MAGQTRMTAAEKLTNALSHHQWPEEVSFPDDKDIALRFWEAVMANRTYDRWLPGDLREAARYCRLLTMIEDVHNRLAVEGLTSLGGSTGQVVVQHPLVGVLSTLEGQAGQIARRLALTTTPYGGTKSRAFSDKQAREEHELRNKVSGGKPNDKRPSLLA